MTARVPVPDASGPVDGFWAVVPAGGAGTRLWPLSRKASPKFLHDLTGSGRSLLQETVDRLRPLVEDRVVVVTGAVHAEAVSAQLPDLPAEAVVAEPSGRDSMAAIGLAAAMVERRDPDAVIGSFAADHAVRDRAAFGEAVRLAVAVARAGRVVTLGIDPTHPATAYGYIHLGEPLAGHDGAHEVVEFVEKPARATADEYLATGRYRWNAGMFVVRPTVLLDLLEAEHPGFARDLRAIAAEPERLAELWSTLPAVAIDHAVAEPAARAGRVAVVPVDLGWDDIGDFDSLATVLADGVEAAGLQVLGDGAVVLGEGSTGLVVPAAGKPVAVLGLDDVVVVDTPDALLVTTRARAQEVKDVVARLRDAGRDDLL
ncbi:mannose-1-phosphate guanylyltransferase [Nocardioides sp. GCM10027113]|uniref:mannose-1-phosphate guanylyltransferase n=1 Tax=unclassified Nocardioides TaxID=2615069 RepID=UPI0036151947